MGTRHLIAVVLDGEFKVAQYGQWDGYPSGQGVDVTKFIKEVMDEERFLAALRETKFFDDESWKKFWADNGVQDLENAPQSVIEPIFKAHPELSRDTSSNILKFIQDKGVRFVRKSLDFANDSLFCEWAYVLDMDRKVLEVYTGFQQVEERVKGRFKDIPWVQEDRKKGAPREYFSVSLIKEFPFAELTVDSMKALEKSEDEEEPLALTEGTNDQAPAT